MTDLSEVLKDHSFASKDRLLAAMATIDPPCKTDADLEAYDGRRLLSTPPDADTVKFILEECKKKDVSIDHNTAGRTALGQVISICLRKSALDKSKVGGAEGTEAKEAKAKAYGIERYDAIQTKMGMRVQAPQRIEGKTVKKASEDLDLGTLSRDCYELSGLKSEFHEEKSRKATIGGVALLIASEDATEPSRIGEFVMAIWCFCDMLLAAGYRKITPSPGGPASAGEHCSINFKDATAPGGIRKDRHHITPEGANAYFLAAMTGVSTLSLKGLAAFDATRVFSNELLVRLNCPLCRDAIGGPT